VWRSDFGQEVNIRRKGEIGVYTSPRIRRRYSINNKRRFICAIVFAVLLIALMLGLPSWIARKFFDSYYRIADFAPEHLEMYFAIGDEQGVPWYYLAAIDKAEDVMAEDITVERVGRIAILLRGIENFEQLEQFLEAYRGDKEFYSRVREELDKLERIRQVYEDKVFPIAKGYEYDYSDGFGDVRTYGGERTHEGIDIMCDKGVPVVSVCDGVVEKMGWLELGGWRLGIRGEDGIYYYYAHLSRYHKDVRQGRRVKKGQVIGYVGDSGYGEEGTTGKFAPHLHFGMYEGKEEVAVNPYPFLKMWEKNKVDVK